MKNKFTLFLIIVLVLLGVTGFSYYKKNIYSKEILKLEIIGPKEVEFGQEIEYLVKYKNNGNITLEEPKLIFEFPENSIVIEVPGGEILAEKRASLRQEMVLKDIYPGQEETISFKARLLGKEAEAKVAKASLRYRPKNLKPFYESNTTLTTIIKSIPITFEFDFPSRVESGKKNYFRLNYFSNVDYPLSNLRIKIDYPAGFEFLESRPRSLGGNEWEIPVLNKAEGGRIEVVGILRGEAHESKIFEARLGIWQEEEFILIKTISYGIKIAKPTIFISYQINNSPQYIANPGDYLHYQIFFKNTGEEALENLFMVVKLEGGALDFNTVQPELGQFQKETGSIIWDHTMAPQLRLLPSMEEGKVEFWVRVKEELFLNPTIVTKISLNQAKEEFVNRINTKLIIAQKGYFNQGPFKNSGPLPPRVGSLTTYTIFWQVKNFYNDVRNLKVKANLPPQVKLTGEFLPKEAKFSFDPVSREIVWDIGDLPARAGIDSPGPEIYFQVGLTPDVGQKGEPALLISQPRIIAEDVFTGAMVQATTSDLDTTLPDDPTISPEMAIVQ